MAFFYLQFPGPGEGGFPQEAVLAIADLRGREVLDGICVPCVICKCARESVNHLLLHYPESIDIGIFLSHLVLSVFGVIVISGTIFRVA